MSIFSLYEQNIRQFSSRRLDSWIFRPQSIENFESESFHFFVRLVFFQHAET